MDEQEFVTFVARIRKGDPNAAEELLRRYEPLVRRQVRMQLSDTRMTRLYESVDYAQSVFASFFFRAAGGEYQLDDPQSLIRLLVQMTRNKVASGARRQLSNKRDGARRDVDSQVFQGKADRGDSPSQMVSFREMVHRAEQQLSTEELAIVELRREGSSWEEVAAKLGGTAQARRMQHARAMERVSTLLELEAE